ncbi:MAG TPA: 2-oxoacid:acceptor oxidoreductase subunit alpha [Atribacter sp.]|jgi:2-oxoglutarate ferredoxin oxidoreductase subunit alpha|uniref:2-oxoacid:acceptor oxidoreductase subunit alpha n=1 Tax=Atribacter sp. TaxID=2847780 RepID=UPI0017703A84|nr:2-oxoacid:acceptor oxidoreductase subunit alpha [Atribacter sp.]MDD3713468.1 2-oxoacid:acceptor oxidoreductase subunit alpha [Atribacterota bacterium]MDI9593747.1 2-oxoacid:acceptor oxidoreductase subunit alpha [Atribacterota bacterium]HHT09465.1 2-oxoacid:acceptor oxidoreductase subunit alpha [Candidatus Atribacteria bacterium]HQK82332.1 2-oxoacid:acceptor oxidoreductase subunit alpha [Atribacter sp.]
MPDIIITIGGEAGQGVQTIGEVLSRILIRSGFYVFSIQDYHSRIRGGHNSVQIRFSDQPIQAIGTDLDLLVCLNSETQEIHQPALKSDGIMIGMIKKSPSTSSAISINFNEMAEELGNRIFANIIAVGALIEILGIDDKIAELYLEEIFQKKGNDVVRLNKEALALGQKEIKRQQIPRQFLDKKNGNPNQGNLLLIGGNEALGLGAILAGCTFYSAYPMTPSTGVMNFISSRSKKYGIIVEQAEDEIAAINMAIGASYAGAKAMTATSGGGFCLMAEGLGLAAMTETPIVVLDGMRPGPSTGLPTRTSQGDLEFVLSASHDEFPRFVFAPRDPQDAIDTMIRAFNLSDRFQVPVIILSDQYLADSSWTFSQMKMNEQPQKIQTVIGDHSYQRYALTDSGISPRALPGMSEALVVADSDEHDEIGHLTEDLNQRVQMHQKRMKKIEKMKKETQPPVHIVGQTATIIGWGSTYGVLFEAREKLAKLGIEAGLLHFNDIYPLSTDTLTILKSVPKPIVVEGNFQGQLARLLERETKTSFDLRVNRYDGRPFFVNELVDQIREVLS